MTRSAATTPWSAYLGEAVGLFGFMLAAGAALTVFEHPGSPVRQAIDADGLRRAALGLVMALVTAAIVFSPWGRRTGAHINPAVTLAFWRLDRISGRDAVGYALAQTAGALLAPAVLLWAIGGPFAGHAVRYGTSQPGPGGAWLAFAAEFVIAFVLMLALLYSLASPHWKKWSGAVIAVLIGVYITVESPLSGMSLNPARSLGAAVTAGEATSLWLYFAAPLAAMLLAAEVFRRHRGAAGTEALPRFPVA